MSEAVFLAEQKLSEDCLRGLLHNAQHVHTCMHVSIIEYCAGGSLYLTTYHNTWASIAQHKLTLFNGLPP